MEMQLASKEKAARNAQTRAEVINSKIDSLYNKTPDLDQLQDLCVELSKENVIISGLHDEAAAICNRFIKNRKPLLVCCFKILMLECIAVINYHIHLFI